MSFANLKRNRGQDNLADLAKKADKLNQKGGERDERYWSPTVDKQENGSAVLRFLPAPEGEDTPWVRIFRHNFKGPGGYYNELSLTTIGKDDPLGELNSSLWNASEDDESPERKQARSQKRQKGYVANIYVVSDPAAPENEGKVFLWKFGQKIFDKITDVMNPADAEDPAINPFDLWEGANFRLKIRKFEGYRNYDKSSFGQPGPLSENDDELEAIYQKEYSLAALIAPEAFKSYDELKARLNKVLGTSGTAVRKSAVEAADEEEDEPVAQPKPAGRSKPAPVQKAVEETPFEADEEENFFANLANSDD